MEARREEAQGPREGEPVIGSGESSREVQHAGMNFPRRSLTGVVEGEGVVRLVGDDVDEHLRLALEDGLVRQGLEANLVERIGGVGDELAKENLCGGVREGRVQKRE